jgi:hypothetical protein
MMDIVTKKNAYWGNLMVSHNLRFTVPDDIGQGLIARGIAEQISPDILSQETTKEPKKKGSK